MLSHILTDLSETLRSAGDLGAARSATERALEVNGRHVRSYNNAVALLNLGGVTFDGGDVAAAARYFRESLSIAAEVGVLSLCADAIDGLAAVALEAGNQERSALLAGAAEALYDEAKMPRSPFEQALRDRYETALRASLDPDTLARAWARGRAMGLEAAVAEALQSD